MSTNNKKTTKLAKKYAWDEEFEVFYEEFNVGDLVAFNDKHANGNMKFGVIVESVFSTEPIYSSRGLYAKYQLLKIRTLEPRPRLYTRDREILYTTEPDLLQQTLDKGITYKEFVAIESHTWSLWNSFSVANRLSDKNIFRMSEDLIKHIKSESVRLANAYAVVSMYESESTFKVK